MEGLGFKAVVERKRAEEVSLEKEKEMFGSLNSLLGKRKAWKRLEVFGSLNFVPLEEVEVFESLNFSPLEQVVFGSLKNFPWKSLKCTSETTFSLMDWFLRT